MTKKDIKAFFRSISDGDLHTVSALITSDKAYLSLTNFSPPKKDDGQSPLQMAFKTGNFDIARLLIENGADVNFQEVSAINDWTAPVLHDAIRATIFNTYTLQKDSSKFNKAFSLLQLMLANKANPNATDSFGNNCLHRAILDARQMIDNPGANISNGILLDQLRNVFAALINAGADKKMPTDKSSGAVELISNFRLEKYQLM